jgi:hypothetical protein
MTMLLSHPGIFCLLNINFDTQSRCGGATIDIAWVKEVGALKVRLISHKLLIEPVAPPVSDTITYGLINIFAFLG